MLSNQWTRNRRAGSIWVSPTTGYRPISTVLLSCYYSVAQKSPRPTRTRPRPEPVKMPQSPRWHWHPSKVVWRPRRPLSTTLVCYINKSILGKIFNIICPHLVLMCYFIFEQSIYVYTARRRGNSFKFRTVTTMVDFDKCRNIILLLEPWVFALVRPSMSVHVYSKQNTFCVLGVLRQSTSGALHCKRVFVFVFRWVSWLFLWKPDESLCISSRRKTTTRQVFFQYWYWSTCVYKCASYFEIY